MSSQQSEIPIRTTIRVTQPTDTNASHHDLQESIAEQPEVKHDTATAVIDLDPYASPAVYYGQSHAPRKVAKSRTLSAVGVLVLTMFA